MHSAAAATRVAAAATAAAATAAAAAIVTSESTAPATATATVAVSSAPLREALTRHAGPGAEGATAAAPLPARPDAASLWSTDADYHRLVTTAGGREPHRTAWMPLGLTRLGLARLPLPPTRRWRW